MDDRDRLAPLLALGATDVYTQPWPDYVSWLNLTEAHVPELLRIIFETPWENRDWDHEPDAWAPIHAWRAIGQLRSQTAIQPLIDLIDRSVDNEWVWSDIPLVFAMLGPLAIAPLSKYVRENPQKYATTYTAITALSQIGQYYPDATPLIAAFLNDRLSKAPENHPAVNGYLVRALVDLKAEESVPVIREAFEEGLVDESVTGEWYDILVEFGLADPLDGSPRHASDDEGGVPGGTGAAQPSLKHGKPENKKDKSKRKQAKKSKKANRRKH